MHGFFLNVPICVYLQVAIYSSCTVRRTTQSKRSIPDTDQQNNYCSRLCWRHPFRWKWGASYKTHCSFKIKQTQHLFYSAYFFKQLNKVVLSVEKGSTDWGHLLTVTTGCLDVCSCRPGALPQHNATPTHGQPTASSFWTRSPPLPCV